MRRNIPINLLQDIYTVIYTGERKERDEEATPPGC